jgi:hypothetical protein
MRRFHAWFALSVCAVLLTACTLLHPRANGTTSAVTQMPADATAVLNGATAFALALQASRTLFRHTPIVILSGAADLDAAAATAHSLHVPLLLTPAPTTAGPTVSPAPSASRSTAANGGAANGDGAIEDAALVEEVHRLGATTELTVGDAAAAWAGRAAGDITVTAYHVDTRLPAVLPGTALSGLVVLATDPKLSRAAAATADAAGADVLELPSADPRADSATVKALSKHDVSHVLALGAAFGPADQLRERVATAATGVELPGGGQVVFLGRTMVALYGHPGNTVLGSLGEQPLDRAVTRAKKQADAYRALVDEPVIPAFEIIATVAAASAESDGSYSSEASVDFLRPWVEAAQTAGMYVVLDLQPGRTDFLTQAKLYTDLLLEPNVGLALDPEWRLKPNQVHMVQIGSVSAAEINATSAWLDELTRSHHLPQKVMIVHQFQLDMITNGSTLVTDHDGVRIVIHVDGFGTPAAKHATWDAITASAPDGVFFGWKNFYDEDKPSFTPSQTMVNRPRPVFVSYQ